MTAAFWFWVIYVVSLIFGVWFADRTKAWWFGAPLVYAILFFLLGWRVFGAPLKGH